MATCRTYTVEKAPTPGFLLTASQYEGIGTFLTNLHISYPAGAGKVARIINSDPITGDICMVQDITLDPSGNADVLGYSVTGTQTIYAILKNGTDMHDCCTDFNQSTCQYSNFIQFTVSYIGNIQFLSNPSGASIWLAPSGQTPSDTTKITPDTITGLSVGNYDYILKLTNYNNYIGPVPIVIIKDQTAIVGPINLIPAEGCIYFISSPQGAHIYLAPVGQTPTDTGLVTPNIICNKPNGDYTYKLTLPGYDDKTGTVTIGTGQGQTVTNTLIGTPVLTDITISPSNPYIAVNTDQQFSATTIDQYGNPIAVTVTWSSNNTYTGTIDPNTGMFSALHTGTTIITATSASVTKTTTATVTMIVPVLHTITVSPATVSIIIGNATVFTATTLDQFGNSFPTTVTWSSSHTNVGIIDQNGVFTALSVGSTVISATSGSIAGIAVANVTSVAPPGGGIGVGLLGNINTAALILGVAMIGSVIMSKQPKFEIIEKKGEEMPIPPHKKI